MHLTSNNLGGPKAKSIYQLTIVDKNFKQETITSTPIAYGGEYYFDAKKISQIRSLELNTYTETKSGLLKLSCNDINIEIPAVASLMYVDQDNSDKGQCLLSPTPSDIPITPCG